MKDQALKILLVGDASSYHRTLAEGLRRLGHEATVVSAGSHWLDTERDVNICRRGKGKLWGLELWLKMIFKILHPLREYDVVSIASQNFIELRPKRQKIVYDYLRKYNRSIFDTALGTDTNYVKECLDPSSPIQYSEFRIFGKESSYTKANPSIIHDWTVGDISTLNEHIYNTLDGATSALYEYDVALHRVLPQEKIAYAGIPIDTKALQPVELPDKIDKVRFFLGRYKGRLLEKGTDVLEAAAREVVRRHPDNAELIIVENRPYKEYLELLKSAHVVLDQLYSYTPATNALQAMAYGLCTVSGGAPEFYDFIGENEMHPVIHVEPDYESAVSAMEEAVVNRNDLRRRGLEGRRFVEKHNDFEVVARRCLDFWSKRIEAKEGKC